MDTSETTAVGRKRLRTGLAIALALASIVLAGCGASANSTTTEFTSESAHSIVSQARVAMSKEVAVSASGTTTAAEPSGEKLTATQKDYAGSTSGSQVIKTTSANTPSVDLPSGDIRYVHGALYIRGNSAFWTANIGLSQTQAATLVNTWVHVPSSSPIYTPTADDLTMSTLTADLFDTGTYHKDGTRIVDGQRTIKIVYTNKGVDAGPTMTYVAISSHLPVMVTAQGFSLHLGGWGKTVSVAAPRGSAPLPSLVPSGSSGGVTIV